MVSMQCNSSCGHAMPRSQSSSDGRAGCCAGSSSCTVEAKSMWAVLKQSEAVSFCRSVLVGECFWWAWQQRSQWTCMHAHSTSACWHRCNSCLHARWFHGKLMAISLQSLPLKHTAPSADVAAPLTHTTALIIHQIPCLLSKRMLIWEEVSQKACRIDDEAASTCQALPGKQS
jgi:hypothetical protein